MGAGSGADVGVGVVEGEGVVARDEMLVRNRFMARTAPTALRSARRGQKFSRTVSSKSTSVASVVIHLSLSASAAVGRSSGFNVNNRRMKSLAIQNRVSSHETRCT